MKFATITILPLLASAAVVPVDHNWKDSTEPYTITKYRPEDVPLLEKRQQFWNSVGKSLQTSLPGFLRWVADNVTWMLKWQEQPLKKIKLVPTMDQRAQKAVFRYGPWFITGANVGQL